VVEEEEGRLKFERRREEHTGASSTTLAGCSDFGLGKRTTRSLISAIAGRTNQSTARVVSSSGGETL